MAKSKTTGAMIKEESMTSTHVCRSVGLSNFQSKSSVCLCVRQSQTPCTSQYLLYTSAQAIVLSTAVCCRPDPCQTLTNSLLSGRFGKECHSHLTRKSTLANRCLWIGNTALPAMAPTYRTQSWNVTGSDHWIICGRVRMGSSLVSITGLANLFTVTTGLKQSRVKSTVLLELGFQLHPLFKQILYFWSAQHWNFQ